MPEKPVATGFSRATKLTRTGPCQFSCGPPNLGDGLDRLWSTVAPFGGEKLDKTGQNWTLKHYLGQLGFHWDSSGLGLGLGLTNGQKLAGDPVPVESQSVLVVCSDSDQSSIGKVGECNIWLQV